MATKQERQRMNGFILRRLEESGLYFVQGATLDDIVIKERNDVREHPFTYHLVMYNSKRRTIQDVKDTYKHNVAQGVHTGFIVLKDGEVGFVPMAGRGHFKRKGKSLKNYDPRTVNHMIYAREIEKYVLSLFPAEYQRVTYYQPKTDQLAESVRIFWVGPVIVDYGHLTASSPGYRHASKFPVVVKDFRETKEVAQITKGPLFAVSGGSSSFLCIPQEENRKNSDKVYAQAMHALGKELGGLRKYIH